MSYGQCFCGFFCLASEWALNVEVGGTLCIATHACIWMFVGTYISAVPSLPGEYTEDFTDSTLKRGKWSSRKTYARFVNDAENGCRIKDQRYETESASFILTKLLNSSACSGIGCEFLLVGTIFNLAKVNTVPCMFTATLSLSLR